MLALVLIDARTESDISLRLFHPDLELPQPGLAIPVHVLIELLEPREHCARGRTDDKKRFVILDGLPAPLSIGEVVEIVSAFDVHRFSGIKSGLSTYGSDPLRTKDLGHVNGAQLLVDTFHVFPINGDLNALVGLDLTE